MVARENQMTSLAENIVTYMQAVNHPEVCICVHVYMCK